MENKNSNGFGIIRMALLGFAGYALWRNRFRMQRFLEANGISTPWLKGNIGETIQSGIAKVAGTVDHADDSSLEERVS